MSDDLGRFGPWIVERPVGRGAMATVFRCHHEVDPTRLAAVKVLHDTDGERLGRFAREVRVLRRLDHPGIVRVLDAGIDDPDPWIALELVRGEALHLARPGARPPDEVSALAIELADALVHAHRVGVYHRDVKPSNVLVDREGRVRLVDFGIAVAVDEVAVTDPDRLGPGTLAYCPPEWFRSSGSFSPRLGDAYALGVVLWELLTGQRAFRSSGDRRLAAVLRDKSEVRRLDPGDEVPAALRLVVVGLTTAAAEQRLGLDEALARLTSARAAGDEPTPPLPLSAAPVVPVEPSDTFVGREAELARVEGWLAEGTRLVTITGPGGVGKSRLAARVATRAALGHPGGAIVCGLASAADPDGVIRALGRALEVPLVEADASEQLVRALRARGRTLLVLDDVEAVVEPVAALIARWVGEVPELVLVVTSRERLRVSGERVFPLPPLSEAEGVRLLVARARDADVELEPSEALEAVVRAFDGLPLALELAAARARVLTPSELARRATDPLTLLTGGRRGGPERHGTLRACLDWSWGLLSDEEREVLVQCSVFEGVFALDAAEAVVETAGGGRILDLLQGLCDRSLLQVRRREGGFVMLRTVRAYAAARLGGASELRRRHAAWFARLVEVGGRALGPSPAEVDDARAACDWAIAKGEAELALRNALVVGDAAHRAGPLVPGIERLRRALALSDGAVLDRVRVELRLAGLLERALRPDDASRVVGEALERLPEVREPRWRGRALAAAARIGWLRRPPEETLDLLEQAIDLLRGTRDAVELARALSLRANVHWSLRQPLDQARRDLEEARFALEAEPDPHVLAMVLGVRAMVLGESLDPVIRLAGRSGYEAIRLDAECMAGIEALVSDELDRASALLGRALDGARRCGFLGREADCAAALAEVALLTGDVDEAERLLRSTLRARGEEEADAHPALCNLLGLAAAVRGQPNDAERWFDEADRRVEVHGLPAPLRVETLALRASILARTGSTEAGARALAAAESLAARHPVDPATMAGRVLARARRDAGET